MAFRRGKSYTFSSDNRLCPNFETMFSDTRPRGLKKKPLDRNPSEFCQSFEKVKQRMEVRGSHRALMYRQPSRKHVSPYPTIVVNLEGTTKKVSFENEKENMRKEKPSMVINLPMKSEKMATKGTQTDFRESEAQTLPWRHEIKADRKLLLELLSLDWFNLEKNYPPGVEEVMLIENARQKLAWENIIEKMRGKKNEKKRKSLVMRMALNEAAFKERQRDEENEQRLEMSRRLMKEAKEDFEKKLRLKLEWSFVWRAKENEGKIGYWNHQLKRNIRKMKSARSHPPPKLDIIAMHKDKSSELYAPKLRHGENPSLGHEIIDIQCRYLKRFHGLEILEKHLNGVLLPKFSKSRQSSKPDKIVFCLRKFRGKAIEEPREEEFDGRSLKVPVPAPTPEPSTPKTERLRSDSEENLYQTSLLLGKLVKGRAIQTEKFIQFIKMASQ